MAGHSQFANRKHRKNAQDAKKSKKFTKLRREIIVAARSGIPDPEKNSKLSSAIYNAKKEGLPKDKIDAAIKSAAGASVDDNYEEIIYEGYGQEGVACIIRALTNNKNRTASDLRHIFAKHGGHLAEAGSVMFLFNHVGEIVYEKNVNFNRLFEFAIEIGASDVIETEDHNIVYCDKKDFSVISDAILKKFGDAVSVKLTWIPKDGINILDEKKEKLDNMLLALEDNDDVQSVEHNVV